MNYLVCVSTVPDTTAKISFTENNTKFQSEGVTYILNPTDEWYALVRALELKEAEGSGKLTVINVGPAINEQFLRKALAIGADDAVLIETADTLEPHHVAKEIAQYAKDNDYQVIVTGKETIDFNNFSVGGMIAEFMEWGYVSQVTKWEQSGDTATVNREVEGGEEIVQVKAPFVLSAQKGLAEQRLPNMKGIMMSKSKPLAKIPVSADTDMVSVVEFQEPQPKQPCKYVEPDNVEELVRLLHEEAKVL